jgi:hypothetical protein
MKQGDEFLIAAGTAHYDNLPDDQQLPSVIHDVANIVQWFAQRGYNRVLQDLAQNPTSADLRREIGGWFAERGR